MNRIELLSIFNRGFGLLASLLLVIMNLHFVQVEGQGVIALINFGILILATLSQFIGGGALIYLIPRLGDQKIAFPSLLWIVVSATITGGLLFFLNAPFIAYTIALGILQSLFVMQQMILLGKEKIASYQIILFTQSFSSLAFVALFYFLTDWGVMAFISGQIWSFILTAVVGLYLTSNTWKNLELRISKIDIQQTIKLGGYAQLGNIFHLGNQRSYLYFLENIGLEGKVFAGVFSILMYVAEALWAVVKSLSSILAARVAQTSDFNNHDSLTKRYLLLGLSTTTIGAVVFMLTPNSWIEKLVDFNVAFLKEGFFFLIPGVIANTVTVSLAHLFSGRGLHRYNFFSALVGFCFALALSFVLIPRYNINGACVSASAAFGAQCLVQVFLYLKLKKEQSNRD